MAAVDLEAVLGQEASEDRVEQLQAKLLLGVAAAADEVLMARLLRSVPFDEAVVVAGVEGEPLFLQGVMFDITERRRLDEELKRSAIASRNSSPRGPAPFSRRTSVSARARRSTAPSSSTRTA